MHYGQGRLQGCLPHGANHSRGVGPSVPPLEGKVLCRYLPAFWSSVSTIHLQPVCLCPPLDHGYQLWSRSDPLSRSLNFSWLVVSQWKPWQELFAIITAACTWGHLLQGQPITVHCDNMAIVQSWSDQSARYPGILHLLQTLFFDTAKQSFIVRLVHLSGKLNQIADALSRNQLSLFSALAPQAYLLPTPVPPQLAEL